MIAFLNDGGYLIWIVLLILTLAVIFSKWVEGPPTSAENDEIMRSISHRENSFLMKRTESKWGTD